MACPCKLVGFGLIGAAILVVAGKSLTKAAAPSTPVAQPAILPSAASGSDAVAAMRSQSRQTVGGSSSFIAPRHPNGHADQRMAERVQVSGLAPSQVAATERLRNVQRHTESPPYATFAQRRRSRRSPLVGS